MIDGLSSDDRLALYGERMRMLRERLDEQLAVLNQRAAEAAEQLRRLGVEWREGWPQ